jgi:hypothetical protein
MRKLLLLLVFFYFALNSNAQKAFCDSSLIEQISNYKMKDGAVFMREYTVMLDSMRADSIIPEQKYSIVLLANIVYRFVILGYQKCLCEPKLKIEDMHKVQLISSNYQKGKKAEQFDITIKETGSHTLKFSFRDGKKGCAIAAIFYVKNTSLNTQK